jgi:rod shape-determining protein MreD
VSVVVLAIALMLQLTFVNRLPWPGGGGGGGPDLVLLAVVALTLQTSPAAGAVIGFLAGLSLDLAPPGSYLIGEYALVLCLVGYLCGRIRAITGISALLTILTAMAVAAVGEALSAVLGRVVSDPQVTWQAIRQVLPPAVIYDVVLTPFVLFAVMWAVRWAESVGRGRVDAEAGVVLASAQPALQRAGATVLGGAGLLGGAGWLSGPAGSGRRGAGRSPRAPRLRHAAARPGDGWIGGARRTGLAHPGSPGSARPRQPRLRPGSATGRMAGGIRGPAAHPGYAAARSAQFRPRRQPNLRASARRHRDGAVGGSLGAAAGGLRRPAASARLPGSAFRSHGSPAGGRGSRPGVPLPGNRRSRAGRGFRPDPRLRGGSASGAGPAGRARPVRRSTLRLGTSRRHDGVLGGRSLGGGALGGRSLGGGALGGRSLGGRSLGGRSLRSGMTGGRLRGLGSRSFTLRLGSRRRRDGTLGGLASRRRLRARRRAAPRFRSGPSLGRRLVLAVRARFTRRKRVRFGSGGRSFLALGTGRLGSRSAVWRIGSKRTGGL